MVSDRVMVVFELTGIPQKPKKIHQIIFKDLWDHIHFEDPTVNCLPYPKKIALVKKKLKSELERD